MHVSSEMYHEEALISIRGDSPVADEVTAESGSSKDPSLIGISKMMAQGGATSTKSLGCKQTHCVKREVREVTQSRRKTSGN